MTDYVTLTELRTLTRQRADMENSQFVDDTELTRYLNNSWGELYNLIGENFNEDYFTTSSTTPSPLERIRTVCHQISTN